MSGQVEMVAILIPAPGKIDQVIEELTALTKHVEANEPDALRYQLYKQTNTTDGVECLVFIEVYKNMAALQAHRTSDAYNNLQVRATELQLLAVMPDIKVLERVGGFASR